MHGVDGGSEVENPGADNKDNGSAGNSNAVSDARLTRSCPPELRRPIRQNHVAVLERLGVDETEHRRRSVAIQQRLRASAADEKRMHPETQLVQQAVMQERAGQQAEAVLRPADRLSPRWGQTWD